jgi:Bacterial Ig-like domain (group 2)
MKRLLISTTVLITALLSACVGTDYIDDPVIGERLTIQPRIDSLRVGAEQLFTVKYSDQYGYDAPANNVIWRSSAPARVSVGADGKAKALAAGKVVIYATQGNATDSLVLNTPGGGPPANTSDTTFLKRGTLTPVSSAYFARGGITVLTVNGTSKIVTAPDFAVSAGPSLYLLLTNHTNGRYTVTPGGNATNNVSVQITPNKLSAFSGVQTWSVPAGVNPANYQYAVFYCTLGPVFGFAELR